MERNGARRRTMARTVFVVSLAIMWAVILAVPVNVAAAAVMGTPFILEGLMGYLPIFLLFGIVGLVVLLAGWKSLSVPKKMAGAAIVAVFLALALVPALTAQLGPGGGPPPGGYVPQWEIILQGTRSTARDGASEIFDTQGGTGGGGETPTATLCAYATNAQVDIPNKILQHQFTVDDDVTTGTAAFSAPDICSVDFSFRLTNPQDANGDGTMDSVSIFGRVRSISATESEDGNGSSTRRALFQKDTTFGWYLGFSRDVDAINTDGQWISIAPAGTHDQTLPTGGFDWQNLGTNAGADEDYATYAYIFKNYGPYGYTLPAAAFTYTMLVDIGTPASFQTVTVYISLVARA